jgi:hypothetical protein
MDWGRGRYLGIGYEPFPKMGYTLWDVIHKDIEEFRTVESNALPQELNFSNLFEDVVVV